MNNFSSMGDQKMEEMGKIASRLDTGKDDAVLIALG